MVRRVLHLLSTDVSGVHAAAYVLGASALASQLLALIRDRLLAHTFGAGLELDIYYAAFRIQDFVFFSVASLVSLAVLLPMLVAKIEQGHEDTRRFLDGVFTVFFVLVSVVGVSTALLMPFIVPFLFPGLLSKGFDSELLFLARILLLSPVFFGISNLLASITQAYRKYYIYALSPLLYNVGIIVGILFFYPALGLRGLGFGVLLGALLHLGIQVPFIVSSGLLPRFTFTIDWQEIRRLSALSLPRTLTLSLNHVALLGLLSLASLMKPGSISIFSFALNLQSVPVAIIGASYSVAAFPVLARHFLKQETEAFAGHFTAALKHILFWSFPIITLFIVLRAQIVRVVLGSGAFSWDDTRLTAASLALFAISIVAQNISLLFIRSFYATGQTRKPLLISICSAVLIVAAACVGQYLFTTNAAVREFFGVLLRVDDLSSIAVLALPLAYSIGAFTNLALFWISFRRFLRPFSFTIWITTFHSLVASVCMGLSAYISLQFFSTVFDLDTFTGIFLQGLSAGVIGIGCGVLMLLVLRNEEFLEIVKTMRARIFRREVVATDQEM